MSKIIWIDLWTTNSCVSYMLWDKSEVIANSEWVRTTPSIVYIKWDELLVWDLAKRKAVLEPKNVIYEVKRWIWKKYDEVKDELKKVTYDTKKWSDWWVLIVVDWKEYKPEQISAFVLQKLKTDAEKFLWEPVTQAIITVPAYFNDSQRNATKAAWEIAWLKVERIINEPTAASLAYWENNLKDEDIVIFDLWWWTLDVTVLEIWWEWTFQVLATSWNTSLWWANFDNKITEYILEEFKKKNPDIDLTKDSMAMQRIKDESEKAKKQLSTMTQLDISIPFITQHNWKPVNLEVPFSRAIFENICKDLFEACKKPLKQALQDSWLKTSDINEVILVWWSTRMSKIKDIVKEVIWKEPKSTVNPDESVAQWASIQWWIIKWDVKDILLLDVTPLSLWVEVEWWICNVLIPRNTTIPVKKSNIYTTATDNQSAVTVHVTQWERQFARDNKSLWMFNLEWIPPMRRWTPQIEVTFDIDVNWILKVTAQEKSTWKIQEVTIQGSTNISEEEIEKAKAEAEKFAEEDKNKKEIIEKRNQLEQLCYSSQKILDENKDKIWEEKFREWEEIIKNVQEQLTNQNLTKDQLDDLEKEFNKLHDIFQVMQQPQNTNQNQWNAQEWEVIDVD